MCGTWCVFCESRRKLSNEYLIAKSLSVQTRTSPVNFARSSSKDAVLQILQLQKIYSVQDVSYVNQTLTSFRNRSLGFPFTFVLTRFRKEKIKDIAAKSSNYVFPGFCAFSYGPLPSGSRKLMKFFFLGWLLIGGGFFRSQDF